MPTVAELTAKVGADGVTDTRAELLELHELLQQLAGDNVTADVNVPTENARRDLDDLQLALFDLDQTVVEPEVHVPVPRADIEELRAALQAFDKKIVAEVDLDKGAALAELAELRAALKSLSDEQVNIDLDTGAALARLVALEAALKAIPDETVTVEVDKDGRGADSIKSIGAMASRAASQVNALTMLIVGLGPVLVPITAVASAALGALGMGFIAAGVASGLLAGVVVTNFGSINDVVTTVTAAQKAYTLAVTDKQREAALAKEKAAMESLTPPQRAVVEGYLSLKAAWTKFATSFQPQIFKVAADGMSAIEELLPNLAPMVQEAANSFQSLELRAIAALRGPFWADFLNNMNTITGPVLSSLGAAFGNIITGIAGILNAFSPMAVDVAGGFEDMTAKFAAWGIGLANNPGFKAFIEYVRQNTPGVIALIGSLWNALVEIVKAAAPIGTALVGALKALFDGISSLNSTNPSLLTFGLALAGIAVTFLNLLGPILNIVGLLKLIAPIFGVVSAAALGWALLVIAAIAAVVAIVIYCWTHFEGFRNVVMAVWNAIVAAAQAAWPAIVSAFQSIVSALQTAWSWMVSTFGPGVSAVVQWIVDEFNKLKAWFNENSALFAEAWNALVPLIQAAWNIIVAVIKTALDIIVNTWNALWPGLSTVLQGVWTVISGIISNGLQIIRGIITVVLGLISGDWDAVWRGLGDIVGGVFGALWAVISGGFEILLGIFRLALGAIRAVWDAGWAILENLLGPVIDGIIAVFKFLWNVLVGNSIIPDLVNAIIQWFTQAASFLSSVFGPVIDIIVTLWNTMLTVITTVLSAIWSVISTIIGQVVAFWNTTWAAVAAVVTTIWATIKSVVDAAINAVAQVINTVLNLIVAVWRGDWTTVGTILSTIWATIKSVVSAAIAAVQGFIQSGMSTISSIWSAAWSLLSNAVTNAKDVISGLVSGMVNSILNIVTGIGSRLYSAGASIMGQLADGIRSAIGAVTGAAGSAISAVTNLLPGSPAKEGPLSGQGWAYVRGQHFSQDLAAGIQRGGIDLPRIAGDFAMTLSDVVPSSPAGLSGGGTTVHVDAGAVQVQIPEGMDPQVAREAFNGAGDDLARAITLRLKRL